VNRVPGQQEHGIDPLERRPQSSRRIEVQGNGLKALPSQLLGTLRTANSAHELEMPVAGILLQQLQRGAPDLAGCTGNQDASLFHSDSKTNNAQADQERSQQVATSR